MPYKSLNKEFSLFGFGSGARINSSSTTLEQSLRQILFKLDYSLAHLCLSKGLPSEECELTEPFTNLYTFLVKIVGMKVREEEGGENFLNKFFLVLLEYFFNFSKIF